jgi:hypothetical protein
MAVGIARQLKIKWMYAAVNTTKGSKTSISGAMPPTQDPLRASRIWEVPDRIDAFSSETKLWFSR